MSVQRFRKRPVTVDAMHWDGTAEGARVVIDWILQSDGTANYWCRDPDACGAHGSAVGQHDIMVRTLEGQHIASPGDWIIRGVQGEFYPCKPDIFAATYELAD